MTEGAEALDAEDELPLVPARMVNELLYCERLMYLEWVQGEWADNEYTVDGTWVHRRVDRPKVLKAKTKGEETPERPYQARSVALSSAELGVTA
ncbi:MAG: CRISPR-associated endonuclease Cas4/Cas1, partial [Myxococcales bacterium]|nr:CRISPR-associated endonuclease Cas4/Cas1 [Myxococcales bacterium]